MADPASKPEPPHCALDQQAAVMTDDRPAITPEEIQRRRKHVETAIADSRLEGMIEISAEERAIFDAYIRGEIDAGDLVTEYKRRNPR
jgi:hypothetical protein